ncbi:MAG: hypothetical protein AAF389_10095 [Gemmatimonadota bacterium]
MRHRLSFVFALVATLVAAPVTAQLTVEVHGSFGITNVHITGFSGSDVLDSDKATSGAHAQLFFGNAVERAPILGVELGYQYLFFYEFAQGANAIEQGVDAVRAMVVGRVPLGGGEIWAEGAAGAYRVEGSTSAAVGAGVAMTIRVAPTVQIPLRLRTDVVLDSNATIVPVMASMGLSVAIGG